MYTRSPFFRARKGPKILFEIANIQNNQRYRNCTNSVNKHEKKYLKTEKHVFVHHISITIKKKSLIVVCFLVFVKCLSIVCSIFKQSTWTASPLVENKKNFWRTSNARRGSNFQGHFIGCSSKPLLTSNTT